jgi:hypothetical protein
MSNKIAIITFGFLLFLTGAGELDSVSETTGFSIFDFIGRLETSSDSSIGTTSKELPETASRLILRAFCSSWCLDS